MKLDSIDRRILRALQRDGRQQNVELAKEVGLSPSPCLRRVRLLEEAGVIERYVAVLNPAKVGRGLTVFTRVWLKEQDADTVAHFAEAVQHLPQVVECHLMAGDCDFLLRVVARRHRRLSAVPDAAPDAHSRRAEREDRDSAAKGEADVRSAGVKGDARGPRFAASAPRRSEGA